MSGGARRGAIHLALARETGTKPFNASARVAITRNKQLAASFSASLPRLRHFPTAATKRPRNICVSVQPFRRDESPPSGFPLQRGIVRAEISMNAPRTLARTASSALATGNCTMVTRKAAAYAFRALIKPALRLPVLSARDDYLLRVAGSRPLAHIRNKQCWRISPVILLEKAGIPLGL